MAAVECNYFLCLNGCLADLLSSHDISASITTISGTARLLDCVVVKLICNFNFTAFQNL